LHPSFADLIADVLRCVPLQKGESVCILGGSGAGKTTLLDILSKRKSSGRIGGEVLYNGQTYKKKSLPTVMAGYVRQDDYHIGALTVYQTLKYAAKLRCHHIPESEWQDRVCVPSLIDQIQGEHVCLLINQPINQSTSLAMICATTDQETARGIELATQETSTCR
jgi:ABC-type cobalamin/Fe3+-siderophores transport system ATPase subunit